MSRKHFDEQRDYTIVDVRQRGVGRDLVVVYSNIAEDIQLSCLPFSLEHSLQPPSILEPRSVTREPAPRSPTRGILVGLFHGPGVRVAALGDTGIDHFFPGEVGRANPTNVVFIKNEKTRQGSNAT